MGAPPTAIHMYVCVSVCIHTHIYKGRSVGNRKSFIKIACTTNVIVCRVCEGGDLGLPIDGVGTPPARIGTWETVRQNGGALATVH